MGPTRQRAIGSGQLVKSQVFPQTSPIGTMQIRFGAGVARQTGIKVFYELGIVPTIQNPNNFRERKGQIQWTAARDDPALPRFRDADPRMQHLQGVAAATVLGLEFLSCPDIGDNL